MPLYQIIEQPAGFSVERLARDRLDVRLEPWALMLAQEGYSTRRCSFFDRGRLPVLIAARLLGEDDADVLPSPRGQIVEADGPHNTKNDAVGWGVTQLRAWAKGLQVAAAERRCPRTVRPDPNQLSLFQ